MSTETSSSYKTTELIAYVVAVLGVLIASAMVDASDFGSQEAWFYVTLLTIGYMVSRGLALVRSRWASAVRRGVAWREVVEKGDHSGSPRTG